MRKCLLVLCASSLLAGAQNFEVASVKLSDSVGGGLRGDSTHYIYNGPLLYVLTHAFNFEPYRILGPDWMNDTLYSIQANIPPDTSEEQRSLMLQHLLSDRLQMKFHRESRATTVFNLALAKGGLQVTPSNKDRGFVVIGHKLEGSEFRVMGAPITTLARVLEAQILHAPVIDKTKLTGSYDFILRFQQGTENSALSSFASLPAALLDVGLKLERVKGIMDVVVIDTINKVPTEN